MTGRDRSPGLSRAVMPVALQSPYGGRKIPLSTQEGIPGDGERCPVAQACRQVWPGCEPHIEGEQPHVILADGTRRDILLDPRIVEQIGRYDRGEAAFEGMTLRFTGGL